MDGRLDGLAAFTADGLIAVSRELQHFVRRSRDRSALQLSGEENNNRDSLCQ